MKLRGIKLNKKSLAVAGGAGLLLVLGTTVAAFAFSGLGVKGKLEKAFPQADIMAVDCSAGPAGLCEVIAGGGKNVFYASRDGRFALVGSVLDLETKKDVTDQRLRDLAAMNAGVARITGQAAASPQQTGAAAPSAPASSGQKVSLSGLPSPASSAIVHNPGAAIKMVVFTDLNCGYCQRLADDLARVTDIEVTEYPVAILSGDSLEKAKLALCSNDRAAAVTAIHKGGEVKVSGDCKAAEEAVRKNTDFFHQAGFGGTPVIVRADGNSNEGWMPQDQLRSFLGGRS